MNTITHSRKYLVYLFTLLILGILPFGSVFAEGEILACLNDKGGLRVVEALGNCKKNETPLSWNIQGPQGEIGPQGPQGVQGVAGPPGPQQIIDQPGACDSAVEGLIRWDGMQMQLCTGNAWKKVVLTSPAKCAAGDRYEDPGDGTVLDCNTGVIWLKNANCFGKQDWDTATAITAGLADGMCGLTDGSVPGDWRLPTIGEFCSEGEMEGGCPAANAVDSLVNTNFNIPTVSNAAGTGPWVEGDAFSSLIVSFYWSSSTSNLSNAWRANLSFGVIDDGSKTTAEFFWPVRDGQ